MEKLPTLRLLMLIAAPKLAEKAAEMFKQHQVIIQYRFNAEGTAPSEIADTWGFGGVDKGVLLSVMHRTRAEDMLKILHTQLQLDTINSGIAFTMPLSGVSNIILKMLSRHDVNEERNEEKMSDIKHVLIAAVVDRGFSGEVMTAAREAGARGGTVIHSRNIEDKEVATFWGVSSQEEKEIVMILADVTDKVSIMKKICEKCGVNSDAHGVVMSLPIDSVLGI